MEHPSQSPLAPQSAKRRQIGYRLTIISLFALEIAYGWSLYLDFKGDWFKSALSAAMTLVPLLLLTLPALRRDLKTYQILALLAPWHFFVGGWIWLWGKALWGAWFCAWALLLQIGTILHNYQKRKRKKPTKTSNPSPQQSALPKETS
ncbi:MAG: ABC transporter [Cardiobacteriaceae bacterium]|nr:ABC transporter [Cardiobacteriaceae bacterium]